MVFRRTHQFRSILLLCTFSLLSYAQTSKLFTISNGLISSSINKIIQDKNGFIWLATDNGLNKFDGDRFVVYRKGDNIINGLSENSITNIIQDKKGYIWIGTHSGMWRLNADKEEFLRIPIVRSGDSVYNYHVSSIIETANTMFVATSGMGICQLESKSNILKPFDELQKNIPTPYISNIFCDSRGNFFVSIENKGLYIYFTKQKKTLFYNKENKGLEENQVVEICEKSSSVYIGTNGGLYTFDYINNRFTKVESSNGLNISELFITTDEQLVIGTDGKGIFHLSNNNQLTKYTPPSNLPKDLINKIQTLYVDNNNNVWCSIKYKGLVMISAPSHNFTNFDFKSAITTTSDICVFAVYGNERDVWFGSDGDGILIYNRNKTASNEIKHLLPTKKILAIYEDNAENVWLGTWNDGLFKMDKYNYSIKKQYKHDASKPESISNDRIWCITQDKSGSLWLGTSGDGLCRFDDKTGVYKHFSRPVASSPNSNVLCNNWVTCLEIDDNNNLWAGTADGLSRLNLNSMQFTNYFVTNNKNKGIVVKALETVGKQIWVGTNEGLLIFDTQTNRWKKINRKELNSESIYALVADNIGNVWVTSIDRIFKVNASDFTIKMFTVNDGIQIPEFHRYAGNITPDGKVLFGGINGAVGFDPRQIDKNKHVGNLLFTELLMFNKPVRVGQQSGGKIIIENTINKANKITMAYRDCFFTIRFKILNYINSDHINYQYKMEGYDQKWQSLPPSKDKSATYTNLTHGEYSFRVKAEINNQVQEKFITIVVLAPWWATWWMKLIYLVLISVVLYLVYRYNKYRESDKIERERLNHIAELNEMKLQFFINISHEIRSPVTLIINPLERLLKDATDRNRDLFQMMYRNAQRLLNLVNQLMDIRKIDKGQFKLRVESIELVRYLRNIAADFEFYTDEKRIELVVTSELPELNAYIDPLHFEKVIINLLSNAFKFSPPDSEIRIHLLQPVDNCIQIEVIDSGTGIASEMLESIFDRFIQSNNPVPKDSGTGVGLHLCRLLVHLHGGTISAQNRTDSKGALLRIEIPADNKHFDQSQLISNDQSLYQKKIDFLSEQNIDDKLSKKAKKTSRKAKLTIQIIEDDKEIRSYLKQELCDTYNIVENITASDAIKSIFTSPPDLILSDVMMPGLDGISFCKMVRENYLTSHIPIILLTAKNTLESIKDGLEAGADEYMVKPFNTEILKMRIVKLLEMRRNLEYHYGKEQQFEMPEIEIVSHDDKLMKRINDILVNNLSDERLNVSFLCSEVGISRVHLNRKMRELVNISAQEYIRIYRLKHAATLLNDKKLSIAEVAYAIGFSNPSHFTYRFRMFYGLTPTEFMEKEV